MPKTVRAIGVGRCCSTVGGGLPSDACVSESLASSPREATSCCFQVVAGLFRVAELVAMLGQALLGDRNEQLHAVALRRGGS